MGVVLTSMVGHHIHQLGIDEGSSGKLFLHVRVAVATRVASRCVYGQLLHMWWHVVVACTAGQAVAVSARKRWLRAWGQNYMSLHVCGADKLLLQASCCCMCWQAAVSACGARCLCRCMCVCEQAVAASMREQAVRCCVTHAQAVPTERGWELYGVVAGGR